MTEHTIQPHHEPEDPLRHALTVSRRITGDWSEDLGQALDSIGFSDFIFNRSDRPTSLAYKANEKQVADFFADKHILDAGSGSEVFARELLTLLHKNGKDATVVNINPQLVMPSTDSADVAAINPLISRKIAAYNNAFKGARQYDVNPRDEPIQGEDFLQRNAVAGVLEAAPFSDKSFDVIISSMYFPDPLLARIRDTIPTNFSDLSSPTVPALDTVFAMVEASLREISRLLTDDGVALLGPKYEDSPLFDVLFTRYQNSSSEEDRKLVLIERPGAYELRIEQKTIQPAQVKKTGRGILGIIGRRK